jgi:hypothetical protein
MNEEYVLSRPLDPVLDADEIADALERPPPKPRPRD